MLSGCQKTLEKLLKTGSLVRSEKLIPSAKGWQSLQTLQPQAKLDYFEFDFRAQLQPAFHSSFSFSLGNSLLSRS